MEDRRQWKRRRLDYPEITEITPNGLDPLACARSEIDHDYGARNGLSAEVTSRVGEAALIEADNLAGPTRVCYGMVGLVAFVFASRQLKLIIGVLQLENLPILATATAAVINSPTLVSAYLNETGIVQRSSDGACVGKLEDRALQCLFKLHNEDHVEIQFMLKTVACQGYRNQRARPVALASAIIYGSEDLSDDAGGVSRPMWLCSPGSLRLRA